MKLQLIGIFLFIAGIVTAKGKANITTFNKSGFYSVMASGNIDAVNNELMIVQTSAIQNKDAYEGTLLMKKAGLIKKVSEKINLFKSGHAKLEKCIKNNVNNAELRFLRLMIQENAPPIVNYKHDLQKDKAFIQKSFKALSPDVQHYILDYSKRSKILTPKDF